ncbi:unnamed protein product, partial [Oppiella nova]
APDGQLYPREPKKRALVDRCLNIDMGLGPQIGELMRTKMFAGVDPPQDVVTNLKNNLKVLDLIIGANHYVTGDELTIADLSLLATGTYMDWLELDVSEFANYKRWYTTVHKELPYFHQINTFSKEEREAMVAKGRATYTPKK